MTENEAKFLEKLDELANDTEVDMYSVANLNFFFEESANTIRKLIEEIQQYRAIGTVGEFKALKEKSVAKKPRVWANGIRHCPNEDCEEVIYTSDEYCLKCGTKIDWSE